VSGSGDTLSLKLALTFTPAFAGLKNVYGYAADDGSLNSGWKTLGIWDTAAPQSVPPAAVSVTPDGGAGTSQTFTFTYSSANSYGYLANVHGLFSSVLSSTNGCHVQYQRAANLLYLLNDAGTTNLAGLTPGGTGTSGNSQCTLSAGGSSVSGSGDTLSLKLALTFTPSFAGLKNVYGYAADDGSLNSGWKTLGTWKTGP
jgi:hypothetical protein